MAETTSRKTPNAEIGGDYCPLPEAETSQKGVGDKVKQAAGSAGEQAQRLTEEGKQAGGEILDKARSRLDRLLHNQKDIAADRIASVAQALRTASDKLRQDKNESVAWYAGESAGWLDEFAQSLHEKDLREIGHQAEDFARRRPVLILGSALIGGLLLARFLRHSAWRRE